jgi:hypothetical protein
MIKNKTQCRIWDFYNGVYEDFYLVGYIALYSFKNAIFISLVSQTYMIQRAHWVLSEELPSTELLLSLQISLLSHISDCERRPRQSPYRLFGREIAVTWSHPRSASRSFTVFFREDKEYSFSVIFVASCDSLDSWPIGSSLHLSQWSLLLVSVSY